MSENDFGTNHYHNNTVHEIQGKPSEIEQRLIQSQNSGHKEHIKSFKQSKWRWVQLLLISSYNFACLFGIQVPTPLQTPIQDPSGLNINPNQYNMMQAWFCIPNIILPLLAAPLSYKIGLKTSIFVYAIFMVIGQGIQWVGVIVDEPSATSHLRYYISLIGVIIFGIGSNGGVVLINAFTCQWFFGKELSMSLALGNAVQYLGQLGASVLLPRMYEINSTLTLPYFYSFIIIIAMTIIPVVIMSVLDNRALRYDKKHDIKPFVEAEEHQISCDQFREVFKFGKLFWLVQAMTFFAYIDLCYNNNIEQLLDLNYQVSSVSAGDYMAMQFIIQLPLTPLIGYFTDRKGKRSQMAIVGGILNIVQFVIFLLVPTCPKGTSGCSPMDYIIPLAMGGVANSFFGAVFTPMVALSVPKKDLELSFGILDGMQQLGNSVGPLFQGPILNNTKKQNGFFWFFIQCLVTAVGQLVISVMIFIYDKKKNNIFEQIQQNDEPDTDLSSESEEDQFCAEKQEVA